ncbi:hypothetical protein F8388_001142 [Cannabis sativa]|uniref:UvrD-like helicase ATP-binding domain-containing protein n=1 Tax=Cannabis sativa TaxID=3483 RepID=A0A7J6ES57_CANSA|nr:hypothetical protein F8388_001142 [Cannabis sativa]
MMMMEDGESSDRRKKESIEQFTQTLFSWTLDDISNENLYKDKVEKIPESFESVRHYLGSFVYPLLEETRVQLYSSMDVLYRLPFAEVVDFHETKPYGKSIYQVQVDYWRNRFSDRSKEPYKTLPGDIMILVNAIPQTFSDLERTGRSWSFLSVSFITEDENGDDSSSTYFKVNASKEFELEMQMKTSLFVVFLANLTTNKRVWKALHMSRNLKMLDYVLCNRSEVKKDCDTCFEENCCISDEKLVKSLSSNMNESQTSAVLSCLHMMHCENRDAFELIWGPPGTGKTKTNATLLVSLMKLNYRTLVCAPTNVAITEVASRVLKIVTESESMFCSLGDILLFGNKERLKVGSDIEDIFLEHRVQRLTECLGPLGWNNCFTSMISFLENCVSQYHVFLENELIKEQEQSSESKIKEKGSTEKLESFLDYVRKRFVSIVEQLRKCIWIFCTHLPQSYILDQNFHNMTNLAELLDRFETLLFEDSLISEDLEKIFSCAEVIDDSTDSFANNSYLLSVRNVCLSMLRTLHGSLKQLTFPNFISKEAITEFCFQRASLIFSTASSSFKLHHIKIEPLDVLVIDEAAQLKECESTIPLQLPGIKHAVLFGDEWQLPATVNSKISEEASFGRSLFQRLSSQNHSRHLLNIQYRMHPSISSFPNSKFYHNQILDAPNVTRKSYEKHYLPGSMFGTYSFINVIGGREEKDDDGQSRKNMVEVALVIKILQNLYKAWRETRGELSIGVVSPYSAQVVAIQEKVGKKYEKNDGFQVKVKTIDGFQGGEEDIIVISTVRSSIGQSLDFISKPQRMNVALTRARHCLWILGNERTLANSQSIWEALVIDAKNRHCFYNADDEEDLAKAILDIKKELDQFDDLLNADSMFFRNAKWKLSGGWRPKRPLVESGSRSSLEIMRFKVEGLIVISTVDITKDLNYAQVLKIWDVLHPDDVPKLIKRLDNIFGNYTEDFVNLCNNKSFDGNLEIPKTWPPSLDFVRHKDLSNNESESELIGSSSDGRSYVENSKVSESLLLMKFYSLSHGIVNHLLSDRDGREIDLPYEVTDEQMEAVLINESSFILGRSGTGKTTVLTTKLFQERNCTTLRWMSSMDPKLCNAVKQQVSDLKRFACDGSNLDESSLTDIDDIDDEAQFKTSQTLFMTFLLLATLWSLHSTSRNSRSVLLQTLIRNKEVNYEKFSALYWHHFSDKLRKKLDPSRVFTEIISHIKGGLQSIEASDSKLSREDYLKLSEGRCSNLSLEKRERIYDIFQIYEKMKMGNGEFDLADFVNDLHSRLKHERYKADQMDFVYIDEVQDLTMSQIVLFKHICGNVEEGFVFSGDTAQTIARGVDFRFQDIRHLFYKKFVLEPKIEHGERKEKGLISDIFHLSQNFRTHAGILKLSQSIIELIYHFFPHSIDPLKPETSLIYGESPLLLQCGNDENAIMKIFGNSGKASGKIVGFGAEQCKGLEFQDVLLYNFFGSSTLKNQWRVIYEYMKEQELFDTTIPNFPKFSESKHNIICSELKQLYVAVTRTRQRLWICESSDVAEPIFDYWRKKCLVQSKPLDDSLAQAMQVASSPEEWRSRGIKGFVFSIFLSFMNTTMKWPQCAFERAGDTYWERLSKAAGLKAMADRMRNTKPDEANSILREAAEYLKLLASLISRPDVSLILESRIYLEKCGELRKAAECFSLAGCHERAANVFAKGNFFSECLTACSKGRLFEMDVLERCALHYFEIKDKRSMMKFVKEFNSMDSIRNFLTSSKLCCFDELLLLEEERENFMEAANIAKLIGDTLRRVDLLKKAGNFKESANLMLFYVLANSLWSPGNKGWPLKQFKGKGDLLTKAKTFAKNDTESFYEIVCTEADIIANEQSELITVMDQMITSQRHKSVSGDILSARKILDMHLSFKPTKYYWEEELVPDVMQHSEDLISKNKVSIESLVHFWNFWKDKIVGIFEFLRCLETQEVNEFRNYGEFCLNFLGVWREFDNLKPVYFFLNPEADWARNVAKRPNSGKLVSIDLHQFVSAAQRYWCSEILSVGVKVLDRLQALCNFTIENCDVTFCKSRTLTLIYEVGTFLLDAKILKLGHHESENLLKCIRFSTESMVRYIFPEWPKPSSKNIVLLRRTDTTKSMLNREADSLSNKPTHGQVGRIAMIILDLGSSSNVRGSDFPDNPVSPNNGEKSTQDRPANASEIGVWEMCLVCRFKEALESTYNTNWRIADYISPNCFLYLLEYLLICLIQSSSYKVNPKPILAFLCNVVQGLLNNKMDTLQWIRNFTTAVMEHYSVLVTRLVVLTCLICVNFGWGIDLLVNLLKNYLITEHLPPSFRAALKRVKRNNSQTFNVNLIAEALKNINNPMVIVNLQGHCPFKSCPDAMYVSFNELGLELDLMRKQESNKSKSSEDEVLSLSKASEDEALSSKASQATIAATEVEVPPAPAATEAAPSSSKNVESKKQGGNKSKRNKKKPKGKKK